MCAGDGVEVADGHAVITVARQATEFLRLLLTTAVAIIVLQVFAAKADSWFPPEPKTYTSTDKAVRFRVAPRGLAGALPYFKDKVEGREPAGQLAGAGKRAYGLLERRAGNGRWETVWAGALVNDVSPVDALVAKSAKYVVTFDNWHSAGYGDDVVVVYGHTGNVISSMGLEGLLPKIYIEALPHTVSSIWWSGDHRLSNDEKRLILQVVVPSSSEERSKPRYVELEVDLARGRLIQPSGAAWSGALQAAKEVAASNAAAERERLAAHNAPLRAPATKDERAWFAYMEDAYFRVDPDRDSGYPERKFLRSPKAKDYKVSEGWVRESLLEEHQPGDVIMFASASDEQLAKVIADTSKKLSAGSLRGVRIYLAVSQQTKSGICNSLRLSGATCIHLDPLKSIPQRPERIRKK